MTLRRRSSALLAFLFLAVLVPVSPADAASRPVCATSNKAKLKPDIPLKLRNRTRLMWLRGCVKDGTLSLEARHRHINLDDPIIDATLKVKVYSTTSNGRFLHNVVFEDAFWLGDLAEHFDRGRQSTVPLLPAVTLPSLAPGFYQVGFELIVDHEGPSRSRYSDATRDDDKPSSTTGMKYIKYTVTQGQHGGGSTDRDTDPRV